MGPNHVRLSLIWLLLSYTTLALVGFEEDPYYPICAHGCLRAFSVVLQTCSTPDDPVVGEMVINHDTHADCYAQSDPYLKSLAYCVSQRCASKHLGILELETFWAKYATGTLLVPAKWTYTEALLQVAEPPTEYLVGLPTTVLNETMLANETQMVFQTNTLTSVFYESSLEGQYGVAILVTFIALPIIITVAGHFPLVGSLIEKIKPRLIWPSVIGTYNVRPLPYNIGNAPTLGQTLFIATFVVVNVVMSATDYRVAIPHAWYGDDKFVAVEAYVMWRTGFIPLLLLPLVVLFAGRNNLLLWLSNWSHATYLVLHRWTARVFAIHVIVHSILGLDVWIRTGSYEATVGMSWWIWGIVGTIATVILLIGSGLYVRRWSYEVFLLVHIVMAALTIIGTWYHIWYDFKWRGNYQQPMYAAIGVWIFDRLVRLIRIAKNGMRYSSVTDLGEGYVRIDVPGIRWVAAPGQSAYAFFPTVHKYRPWENHPFSVLPTSLFRGQARSLNRKNSEDSSEKQSQIHSHRILPGSSMSGVTMFVRKDNGMTKDLVEHATLPTLLDGPYSNASISGILCTDRLLVITGGIGITGVLPWMFVHPNAKLFWSVKPSAECLVHAMADVLESVAEKETRIGSRHDTVGIIQDEVQVGWQKIGVVVCGPGSLCDTVRSVVCAAATSKTTFELEVETYSW